MADTHGTEAEGPLEVAQGAGGGGGDPSGFVAGGRAEHERHLVQAAGPARPRLIGEAPLDGAADDDRLALRLDLVGNHETAVAHLEQADRFRGDGRGVGEPAGQLRQIEQLGRPLDEDGVGGGLVGRRPRDGRHPLEEGGPAPERRRGARARPLLGGHRLRHQPAHALGRISTHGSFWSR